MLSFKPLALNTQELCPNWNCFQYTYYIITMYNRQIHSTNTCWAFTVCQALSSFLKDPIDFLIPPNHKYKDWVV